MQTGMAALRGSQDVTLPPLAMTGFLDGAKKWFKEVEVFEEQQSNVEKLKVIDCFNRKVIDAPPDCVYLALSYVWGTNPSCSLDGELPQTIEDSVTVVLHLGYRYLWIDRYCINQTATDKHHQIQQMGAIYACAYITLIAFSGENPTYGLPGISKIIDKTKVWERMGFQNMLESSTWERRAWTFQENYLSRRKLFFTDAGLGYTCSDSINEEIRSNQRFALALYLRIWTEGQQHGPLPTDTDNALEEVEKIIEKYSTRVLSYESDALNAIVGVLNTLSTRQIPVRHIWGMPFVTEETENGPIVTISLHWYSATMGTRRPAFPSWSCLGWTSFMRHYHRIKRYQCSVDFDLEIYQNNEFRHISQIEQGNQHVHCLTPESQSLRITAYSIKVNVGPWTDPENGQNSKLIVQLVTDDFVARITSYWDDSQFSLSLPAAALCVFQSASSPHGLILKRHGEYYERVGVFKMIEEDDLSTVSRLLKRRTIVLR